MFQFAAGHALAARHAVPLKLDTSDFANYRLHQGFELDRVFNLEVQVAENADFSNVLRWRKSEVIRRILSRPRFRAFSGGRFVVEPQFDYWDGFGALGSDCYLTGYWQTEKYFDGVEEDIRRCFRFREPLGGKNIEWEKSISQLTSVSIHIRRGDYVSNVVTNSVHGTCGLDYYRAAVGEVISRVDSPEFFVFSDDIPWVMENLKISYPIHYVSNNVGKDSFKDMQLMSLCRHNIIANSSFSWWGAWLNRNEDKIVIAPKAWFAGKPAPRDLYPETWHLL